MGSCIRRAWYQYLCHRPERLGASPPSNIPKLTSQEHRSHLQTVNPVHFPCYTGIKEATNIVQVSRKLIQPHPRQRLESDWFLNSVVLSHRTFAKPQDEAHRVCSKRMVMVRYITLSQGLYVYSCWLGFLVVQRCHLVLCRHHPLCPRNVIPGSSGVLCLFTLPSGYDMRSCHLASIETNGYSLCSARSPRLHRLWRRPGEWPCRCCLDFYRRDCIRRTSTRCRIYLNMDIFAN